MHNLKLRSDLGGNVLKLVKSMIVTLVRLMKRMDIQKIFYTC